MVFVVWFFSKFLDKHLRLKQLLSKMVFLYSEKVGFFSLNYSIFCFIFYHLVTFFLIDVSSCLEKRWELTPTCCIFSNDILICKGSFFSVWMHIVFFFIEYLSTVKCFFDIWKFFLIILIFIPNPLEGGGTIYSNEFFVQIIFDDRYIHRRELRLVSLESSFSVEYGKKKIFLFSFLERVIDV